MTASAPATASAPTTAFTTDVTDDCDRPASGDATDDRTARRRGGAATADGVTVVGDDAATGRGGTATVG